MYKLDQFDRKKDYLKYIMPFGKIINDPAIVLNKDGSIQTTWKYRGPDLDSAIKEQLGIMTAQLSSVFSSLDTGWVLYAEAQRMPSTSYDTDTYFPDLVTKAIDEERKRCFSAGKYYESNYFMTLYWMPPDDAEGRLKEFMIEGRKRNLISSDDNISAFMEQVNKIFRLFENLKVPVEFLSQDEMVTYLHSTVSLQDYAIKIPSKTMLLDQYLNDDALSCGLEPMVGKKHLRIIVPLQYVNISSFGMFDVLNRLDFSYRWVSRFYFLDKRDALKELDDLKSGWNNKMISIKAMFSEFLFNKDSSQNINQNAYRKFNEVKTAIDAVESDEIGYGYYSTAFIVMDEDREQADEKAKHIRQTLINMGMRAKIEDSNAADAWLSCIPGNVSHNIRRPMISTGNLVHMLPISDIWAGPTRNEHLKAPVLLYAQTEGNTPFRLNLHIRDVGHTMIVGPTGTGKSVHLNMIAASFRKYKNAKVFIFDKGLSSRVLTEAVGGKFFDLGNNQKNSLSFQPLSNIDDENERKWAQEWLCDYIGRENVTITPDVKNYIWKALSAMKGLPREHLTITTFINNLQNKELKSAFDALSLNGRFGSIFDSAEDNLSFSSWQTFEMEKLINDMPSIVGSTLMYIFHRIENSLHGDPTIIILDECWAFFDNPVFVEKIRAWLKVLRKSNAIVVFATQSLDDIDGLKIFKTILESCQSKIFLPNDKVFEASNKKMYESFGLNQRQLEIISTAIRKKQYYYTSPYGSRLYDLAIGPIALAYVATDTIDVNYCQKIISEYGRENFNEHWMKFKNINLEGGEKVV